MVFGEEFLSTVLLVISIKAYRKYGYPVLQKNRFPFFAYYETKSEKGEL